VPCGHLREFPLFAGYLLEGFERQRFLFSVVNSACLVACRRRRESIRLGSRSMLQINEKIESDTNLSVAARRHSYVHRVRLNGLRLPRIDSWRYPGTAIFHQLRDPLSFAIEPIQQDAFRIMAGTSSHSHSFDAVAPFSTRTI